MAFILIENQTVSWLAPPKVRARQHGTKAVTGRPTSDAIDWGVPAHNTRGDEHSFGPRPRRSHRPWFRLANRGAEPDPQVITDYRVA